MRGIRHIFYFLLYGSFLLQSCSVEKRHYRGGYYVHNKNYTPPKNPRNLNPEKNIVPVEQVKNNIAVSKQKAKKFAEALIATASKQQPIFPYRPITLPAPGDTCDTLILKNGTEIKTRIVEITSSTVRYKHCDSPDGPIYNMSLNNVAMILYRNGSKEEFKIETHELGNGPGGAHITSSSTTTDAERVKRKSNTALIFGILSFPGTILLYVGGIVFAILAISLGGSAIRMMRRQPNLYDRSSMLHAKAGMIFGIVYLALLLLLLVLLIGSLLFLFNFPL